MLRIGIAKRAQGELLSFASTTGLRLASAALSFAIAAAAVFAPSARAQFAATRSPQQSTPQLQPGQPAGPPPQLIPLSELAQQAASALRKYKTKKVMVLDFAGSDPVTLDRVGQQIAADFQPVAGLAIPSRLPNQSNIAKPARHRNVAGPQTRMSVPGGRE
ncbi:MAG: hypothetical protein WA209_02300 [Candidatus Acidiferrales bacterium]